MLDQLLGAAVRRTVRPHLKTRQLTLLVHLDEERSLGRAAAAASLTQPAASKLLRQIERVLGVQLFERHARGMVPTCYGEILIRHARLALSALGTAREEIMALKSGLSGRVAIGSVLNPGASLVPMAVAELKQRHRGVVVSVELDTSRQLVQRLLQGQLDMVVGRVLDVDRADEVVYEPLSADEPHAVFAGAHHPLGARKRLGLEDLVDQPWILPPSGSLLRDKLLTLFVQRGLPLPSDVVEASSLPVITTLLQKSHMVVAMPEGAVQCACEAGALMPLIKDVPLGLGAFGLITRRGHALSPAANLLASTLREIAHHLYPAEGHATGGAPRAVRARALDRDAAEPAEV